MRQAIHQGKIASGRTHLAAIASPHEEPDGAAPGALLLLIELKRGLGDDDSELLEFIATRMMPLLKSRRADRLPTSSRLQLVQCYHRACDALDRYPELAGYWAPAARLITELGDGTVTAATLAMLREHHLAILYRLRTLNRLSDVEATVLTSEFERQVQASWANAHNSNPEDPIPYAGLALASERAGRKEEAAQWLERGLQSSSNRRELYLLMGQLLHDSDPLAGAAILEEGYRRDPDDAKIQQSFAELAAAAGRPDRAIEVCRAVRIKRPDCSWACRLEAAICLDAGRPTQSLEALAPMHDALHRDAAAMELYVRAACAVGADAIAAEMLTPEAKNQAEVGALVGGARGYLKANRVDDAVQLAARIVKRFPNHLGVRFVHAEGLRLRAEAGDAAHWPAERVREAIEAYEWLRRREPGNCQVAQRIAWLQLKGLNAPDLALQSIAPLQNREMVGRLTPEMAETLGATLLANDQAEAALAPLTAAIDTAPTRTGAYISRAAAFARLGKRREARADLDRAAALPRTPRQATGWQKVFEMLRGDS